MTPTAMDNKAKQFHQEMKELDLVAVGVRHATPETMKDHEVVAYVASLCAAEDEAAKLSDEQLAQALLKEVWQDLEIGTRKEALVSQAVARLLKRTYAF